MFLCSVKKAKETVVPPKKGENDINADDFLGRH